MKKYYRLFWLISKYLLISILLSACSGEELKPVPGVSVKNLPDEQSDGVKTITMNGEVISMELYARHMDRYYKKKETVIDSLFVNHFDVEGNLESTIKCQNARIDENLNTILCEGEVVIVSENGILKTPLLNWNRNTGEVFVQNGFTLQRGDDVLRGDTMKTDINMNDIEIINVSAEGQIQGNKFEW